VRFRTVPTRTHWFRENFVHPLRVWIGVLARIKENHSVLLRLAAAQRVWRRLCGGSGGPSWTLNRVSVLVRDGMINTWWRFARVRTSWVCRRASTGVVVVGAAGVRLLTVGKSSSKFRIHVGGGRRFVVGARRVHSMK